MLTSTREAASCCHPQRQPGSKSSTSCGGGRAPRDSSVHEGGTKPSTPRRYLAASTADPKAGVRTPPSRPATNRSATPGCRWRIMCNESAQLAQYAGVLVRDALRRPNPPKQRGSVAASRAETLHWSGATFTMPHKQLQRLASCAAAN